jgi:hypothetical protein
MHIVITTVDQKISHMIASSLMTWESWERLSKLWGFHSDDYEECHLLWYKNPVRTSQKTHYISATESSQLMLCKIWVFTAMSMKNAVLLDVTLCDSCKNQCFWETSSPNPSTPPHASNLGMSITHPPPLLPHPSLSCIPLYCFLSHTVGVSLQCASVASYC